MYGSEREIAAVFRHVPTGRACARFIPVRAWPADLGAEELDFETSGGSKSSSGEFSMFVPLDSRVLISKDLSVNLATDSDRDGVKLSSADQSPGRSIWIEGTLNLQGGTLQSGSPGLITDRGTINVNGGS